MVQVCKSFGGVQALRGVDLSVPRAETLGLLGPNGSGKTTLVNCLSGVVPPDRGSIHFEGRRITAWSRSRRARNGMVRTYQSLRLFPDMTVAENIAVGLTAAVGLRRAGRDLRVKEAIEAHGLWSIRRTPVKGLSYGQQRRVEIARALIGSPRVLLLDEPAAGLGENDTADLAQALSAARETTACAIVLIDHDVDFVIKMSDRVAVLHQGRVVRIGAPSEVQQDPMVAEIYLGTAAEVDSDGQAAPDESGDAVAGSQSSGQAAAATS